MHDLRTLTPRTPPLLPLLLLLLDAPNPSPATVRTHTLATLTEQQVQQPLTHLVCYPKTGPDGMRVSDPREGRRSYKQATLPEQIIVLLRKAEVELGSGCTIGQVCRPSASRPFTAGATSTVE